uniref:Uncharacterized protein n=1 Tax=Musa acuminata subsp. malaccensis TaxID=214687 RepID=A0A804IQX7_MUSAM|nr:PREDICTED: uncharacterized membrane protein At3g27390-like [Musa acuminata subsp. malaccensis]
MALELRYIPGACLAGLLGVMADVPMISLIAICKSPYMLFKGWRRLFHDLIGREGPFLETACVPFAGLAIILWPSAVAGAVMASIIPSFSLGAYAAVIAYQETSVKMGLAYIISSMSMFDEYSNDVLDMPEGSCFPRYQYRKKVPQRATSFSRPVSFRRENQDAKKAPSRATSFKNSILELNPLKLLDHLFSECKRHGEVLVSEGVITQEDIQESRSSKGGSRIIRLQGITKSISRYPTARRRFDDLVKSLSEDLEKKFGSNRSANGSQESQRVRSGIFRIFSQKSFGSDTSTKGHHQEIQEVNNGF